MKVLLILAILFILILLAWSIVTALRAWASNRHPWELEEEESLDGMKWRLKAIKPGHERILTDWLWAKDYGEIDSYVARESARDQITEMNRERKSLNG